MTKKNDIDLLNHLSQWAVLNDELLQAYRSLDLTFQSIIMAIGVALFATMMITECFIISCLLYLVLLCIFLYNRFSIIPKMKLILDARSLNRTFFHFKIAQLENNFPSASRYFTQFLMKYNKMAGMPKEKSMMADDEYEKEKVEVFNFIPDKKLDDKEILNLFSKESTGTQKLFHTYIPRFICFIWSCIIIFGLFYLFIIY